ncbi:MAG: S9 family peptidase [Caulobacter sp.]
MLRIFTAPATNVARRAFRGVLAGVLAASAALPGAAAMAVETPLPPRPASQIDELFASPALREGALSPDGRYLAIVTRDKSTESVQLVDLVGATQRKVFDKPGAERSGVKWLIWKDAKTLVLRFDGVWPAGAGGKGVPANYKPTIFQIFAVDVTTGAQTKLGLGSLIDPLRKDPDSILLHAWGGSGGGAWQQQLHKVNVRTGATEIIDRSRDLSMFWSTNRDGDPVIKYDAVGRGGVKLLYREKIGAPWTTAFTLRPRDIEALPELSVLAPGPDLTSFYVATPPQDDQGTRELRLYDFKSRTMGPVIYANPSYDFDSVAFDPKDGSVRAICSIGQIRECDYLDKARQTEWLGITRFFDNERNVSIASESDDGATKLLWVSGPDEPGSYYLYRRADHSIKLVGEAWPKLTPNSLGATRQYNYVASDGQKLIGYLTRPPAAKPGDRPPLVVMPHGGPEARDSFDYDPWVQSLARAGYAVFQPQFRGSGGFGRAFAAAGDGQWGLRMQDDVLEGVEALVKAGQIDADRICIYGASYGGYVALQAGARHPERFKCVISRAGVSDLVAVQTWERKESGADSPRYRYWLKSIGDPSANRAKLVETSPITYAASYGPPVLLLHGDADDIVPLQQSRIMQEALSAAGRRTELKVYPREGHSDWDRDNELDAMDRILAFVGAAIGPSAAKP